MSGAECRSSCRDAYAAGSVWSDVGFRVALSVDAVRQLQAAAVREYQIAIHERSGCVGGFSAMAVRIFRNNCLIRRPGYAVFRLTTDTQQNSFISLPTDTACSSGVVTRAMWQLKIRLRPGPLPSHRS